MEKKNIWILRKRLDEYLYMPAVKNEGDIINVYKLKEVINHELSDYNELFVNQGKRVIKLFNNKQFLKLFYNPLNISFIKKIVPEIKDGKCFVTIELDSEKQPERIVIDNDYDHPELYNLDGSNHTFERIRSLMNDKSIKLYVLSCLASLNVFKERFPNMDYLWDYNNPSKDSTLKFDDGYVSFLFQLDDVYSPHIGFADLDNYNRSDYQIDTLYQMLDYDADNIMRRTPININDLNPLYREIISKEIDLGKSRALKK